MENIKNNIVLIKKNNKNTRLNPFFVTGFSDGEACFHLAIGKNSKYKNGYYVNPGFSIVLHKKDKLLLEKFKEYFGGIGTLNIRKNFVQFRVFSIEDLNIIITHFEQYPLITKKQVDYMLFKEALYLIKNKEHLTFKGLQKIVNIRASMNKGLPESLKKVFFNIIPDYKTKFKVGLPEKINPNWIAGFTEAEGCFFVKVQNNKTKKKVQIIIGCQITQNNRDTLLIKSFIPFFNCGRLEPAGKSSINFVVTKFSDITGNIIPFFEKYSLNGSKAKDFEDWKNIVKLMESKAHLTKEGIQKILKIKSGINSLRNII